MKGTVISLKGNTVIVRTEGRELRCGLRGKLKREKIPADKLAAVGDEVEVTLELDNEGVIENVSPRHSKLSRHHVADPHREQVIVANIDLLVATQAAVDPNLDLLLLDRAIVMGEAQELAVAICINKMDLADRAVDSLLQPYRDMGYPIFATSTVDATGLEGLRELLRGKISAMLGPSGVGKTSLLKAMFPHIPLTVGEVSARTGKGKHTTTWVELYELGPKTWMADTPGIEFFTLWKVGPENLAQLYRDVARHGADCRFGNCSHVKEDPCAVKKAVDAGLIDAGRYKRYLHIFDELWQNRSNLLRH